MKGTTLQSEIAALDVEIKERKQYNSPWNLRNLRKRRARLMKELKTYLRKEKIEKTNYAIQLDLI